ncbi:hypothetical protein PDIDSM_5909 [Penicillium digitatum]|nr:hypothetical protein PDIDSM_5909 [Penicillium digitatum]
MTVNTKELRHEDYNPCSFDVIIVGAGYGGISALYHLCKLGLTCQIVEKGADIGGVWYWNRYPGARTDSGIPSYELNIPECWKTWKWSSCFPDHTEIRQFMDHCDRQIHIREHVLFNRTVIGAQFSQLSHEWKVSLDNLSTLSAKYLVSAIGVTSQRPTLMDKDLKLLNGEVYFPSNWPHREISPEGKDIAIIGTGSTAVQIVQDWGPRAKSLVVYQRCYNTALPIPVVPFDEIEGQDSIEKQEKAIAFRMKTPSGLAIWEPQKISTFDVSEEEREKKLNQLFDRGLSFWVSGYNDLTTNKAANRVAYDFWARKTRAKIHDRRKRDALAPLEPTYLFGIKRPGLDNGYFEQFNRPNVDVVNLRDTPIASFVHDGIVTTEGKFRHHDMVIPAIGFKNVIENMKSLGIKGLDGVSLGEGWADG